MEAIVDGANGSADSAAVDAFVERLYCVAGEEYPTPGTGRAMRFAGEGIMGSALVVRGTPVHMAFFATAPRGAGPQRGRMSDWSERRDRMTSPIVY